MPEFVCKSLYGMNTHEGRVQMTVQEKDFTIQLSIAETRELAMNMIEAAAAAETDSVFAAWCREFLKMDEQAIAAAMLSMRRIRDGWVGYGPNGELLGGGK